VTHFDYTLDTTERPTLGLVVLQTDETIEQDFRRLIPTHAQLYVSRVPSGLEVSRETLAAMEAEIPNAAALFPAGAHFDAVGYGCTSGTSVIGTARIGALVRSGIATAHVTEPVSALVAACAALGLRKIAFLSPYVEEVSAGLRDVLADMGVESTVFGSFNEAEEVKVARIAPDALITAATDLAKSADVDAVFLSCTNLRTLDVIDAVETRCGKPALSSNQVLAWHMAQLAGIGTLDALPGALGRVSL
jgi:maleate isomerase